jgi:hypothetical protein
MLWQLATNANFMSFGSMRVVIKTKRVHLSTLFYPSANQQITTFNTKQFGIWVRTFLLQHSFVSNACLM